jgi:hypothetical protein
MKLKKYPMKVDRVTFPNFKMYYKTRMFKTVQSDLTTDIMTNGIE